MAGLSAALGSALVPAFTSASIPYVGLLGGGYLFGAALSHGFRPWSHQPVRLFISYRRADIGFLPWELTKLLRREFGPRSVFLDELIYAGAEFPAEIRNAIGRSQVMLVLIGTDWNPEDPTDGTTALDNEDDWVRIELELAHELGVEIIPLVAPGVDFPLTGLPDRLRWMGCLQAVRLSPGQWQRQMRDPIRRIRTMTASPGGRNIADAAGATELDRSGQETPRPSPPSHSSTLHSRRPEEDP